MLSFFSQDINFFSNLTFSCISTICNQLFMSRWCDVFRYFGSFIVHVYAESLVLLDSLANFSSGFTNILLFTVAAFNAIDYRAIHFVNHLVVRRNDRGANY
ncbi:unnamed protein product [Protopolystoma xenopodis]|uniref:Uncharacterized protein n=1 Tax=Protopolystoma xenopodis TaxID=117903 RepID=A0A448WND6_9PLAT|nr:unnamed protein product [Protopolystoma xenopodis]